MKANQLVSVIIPAYNTENYIKNCIDSVLNSTYSNIEVIIVDDASTDNTAAVCQSFADSRVHLIRAEHGGVSRARNIGIEHARGEYITFVDADDWVDESMIEKLVSTAEEQSSEITICNHYYIFSDGTIIIKDAGRDRIIFSEDKINQFLLMFLIKDEPIFEPYFPMGYPWATLFKAALLRNHHLRFVDGMKMKEDEIFLLYAAQNSSKIVRINEPLYYYNKGNDNSLTKNNLKKDTLDNWLMLCEKRYEFYCSNEKKQTIYETAVSNELVRACCNDVLKACFAEADYRKYKKLLEEPYFKESVKKASISELHRKERIYLWLTRHHCLWAYYYPRKVKYMLKNRRAG